MGIFAYIYHKNQPNVGKYNHAWIVWGWKLFGGLLVIRDLWISNNFFTNSCPLLQRTAVEPEIFTPKRKGKSFEAKLHAYGLMVQTCLLLGAVRPCFCSRPFVKASHVLVGAYVKKYIFHLAFIFWEKHLFPNFPSLIAPQEKVTSKRLKSTGFFSEAWSSSAGTCVLLPRVLDLKCQSGLSLFLWPQVTDLGQLWFSQGYCWWLVEVGSLSQYLQGFVHPRWLFGISEPQYFLLVFVRGDFFTL